MIKDMPKALKKFRSENSFNQTQVAQMIRVHKSTICYIEKGGNYSENIGNKIEDLIRKYSKGAKVKVKYGDKSKYTTSRLEYITKHMPYAAYQSLSETEKAKKWEEWDAEI